MGKTLFEKVDTLLGDAFSLVVDELDESDTYDWHSEIKNYNADLNALGVLITLTQKFIKDLQDNYDEEDEEEED